MTVAELIEELEKYPQDIQVVYNYDLMTDVIVMKEDLQVISSCRYGCDWGRTCTCEEYLTLNF